MFQNLKWQNIFLSINSHQTSQYVNCALLDWFTPVIQIEDMIQSYLGGKQSINYVHYGVKVTLYSYNNLYNKLQRYILNWWHQQSFCHISPVSKLTCFGW